MKIYNPFKKISKLERELKDSFGTSTSNPIIELFAVLETCMLVA